MTGITLAGIVTVLALNSAMVQQEAATFPRGYARDYEFTDDWFSHNLEHWKSILGPLAGQPDLHYLEVGLFEGRSAMWMLENILTHPTSRLTGIDPFAGAVKDRYLRNLERSGQADRASTIVGYSQEELRKLAPGSFDIIYIDGSHLGDDVLEDAVLSWRLLKKGGVLIFDDYKFKPMQHHKLTPQLALDTFLQFYGRHFKVLHRDYQLVLRRKERTTDKANRNQAADVTPPPQEK